MASSRPRARSGPALAAAGALWVAACDSDVTTTRSPADEGDGGSGGTNDLPITLVEVVGSNGEAFGGVEVLVHDPTGSLLSRHLSTEQPLQLPTSDGNFVSAVWWDDGLFEWRMDTVVVTTSARSFRFHRRTPVLETNPNAPIRLEVAQAIAPGVDEYIAGGPCGGSSGWQPDPVSLVIEDYRGCGDWPTSTIAGMGRDSDQRLLTFDHVEVPHGGSQVATILFPSTPVERIPTEVIVSWPEGRRVNHLGGGFEWHHRGSAYLETFDDLPLYDPPSPSTITFTVPSLPIGDARTILGADIGGGDDPFRQHVRLLGAPAGTWNPKRLRTASFDAEAATFEMASHGPSEFTETGDALLIEIGGPEHTHVFCVPVPADTATHAIPELEMPADFGDTFSREDHRFGFGLDHDDRFEAEGYATYVRSGVGAVDHLLIRGERLTPQAGNGRF